MADTTSITIRLPNDVLAALDHQGGKRTDALVAVLRVWMAGGSAAATGDTAALERAIVRVADLEEALAQSEARASKWQKAAQAAIDPVATKRVPLASAHQSGPVYEPTLNVQGQARPMFRNGSDAEKALKGQKQ